MNENFGIVTKEMNFNNGIFSKILSKIMWFKMWIEFKFYQSWLYNM